MTSRVKGYATEVPIPSGQPVAGVVLCDQVKNLDWIARRATYAGAAPPALVAAVVASVLRAIS